MCVCPDLPSILLVDNIPINKTHDGRDCPIINSGWMVGLVPVVFSAIFNTLRQGSILKTANFKTSQCECRVILVIRSVAPETEALMFESELLQTTDR